MVGLFLKQLESPVVRLHTSGCALPHVLIPMCCKIISVFYVCHAIKKNLGSASLRNGAQLAVEYISMKLRRVINDGGIDLVSSTHGGYLKPGKC